MGAPAIFNNPVKRYWSDPDWAQLRDAGMRPSHALLLYRLRRAIPKRAFSESQRDALEALTRALSQACNHLDDEQKVWDGLTRIGRAVVGHEDADPQLVAMLAGHDIHREVFCYQTHRIGRRKHTYNGMKIAGFVLKGDQLRASETAAAEKLGDSVWAGLIDLSADKAKANIAKTELRQGPDYRQGDRSVSEAALMKTFGLREVGFGPSVGKAERQRYLNALYDGLMDLSRLLAVKPAALGLQERVKIAIGTVRSGQGKAHYQRHGCRINLTRNSGGGALAHEWAHALDHYLGQARGKDRFLSNGVTKAIKNNQSIPGDRDDLMQEMMTQLIFQTTAPVFEPSTYYLKAMEADNYRAVYNREPTELFARAFEMTLLQSLRSRAESSPYLVDLSGYSELQYPDEEERERIVRVMQRYLPGLCTMAELSPAHEPVAPVEDTPSDDCMSVPRQQLGLFA